jgi:hypothetical protein
MHLRLLRARQFELLRIGASFVGIVAVQPLLASAKERPRKTHSYRHELLPQRSRANSLQTASKIRSHFEIAGRTQLDFLRAFRRRGRRSFNLKGGVTLPTSNRRLLRRSEHCK